MVLGKKILSMFHHLKSMEGNDPLGVANLNPRGMVGKSYKGNSRHLLLSCVPHGLGEDILNVFHYKSMGAIDLNCT